MVPDGRGSVVLCARRRSMVGSIFKVTQGSSMDMSYVRWRIKVWVIWLPTLTFRNACISTGKTCLCFVGIFGHVSAAFLICLQPYHWKLFKHGAISVNMLIKYMDKLTTVMGSKISAKLSGKFAVAMDGCSCAALSMSEFLRPFLHRASMDMKSTFLLLHHFEMNRISEPWNTWRIFSMLFQCIEELWWT